MFTKRIATLMVVALVAALVSAPAMAGVGGCKSGNCTDKSLAAVGSAPSLLDTISSALPGQLGALVKAAFGKEKKAETGPVQPTDDTINGVGGCRWVGCACGVGGC